MKNYLITNDTYIIEDLSVSRFLLHLNGIWFDVLTKEF